MPNADKEIIILENIYKNEERVRQRSLARIAGLSLGMTNAIIKRLVNKGWLTIRKLNNRNIFYAVTPAGLDVITRKSFRYLKRTIKQIVQYKELIVGLISRLQKSGYKTVVLIGKSDISFIIEHLCAQSQLQLVTGNRWDENLQTDNEALFLIFSEEYAPDGAVVPTDWEKYKKDDNWIYLRELMLSKT